MSYKAANYYVKPEGNASLLICNCSISWLRCSFHINSHTQNWVRLFFPYLNVMVNTTQMSDLCVCFRSTDFRALGPKHSLLKSPEMTISTSCLWDLKVIKCDAYFIFCIFFPSTFNTHVCLKNGEKWIYFCESFGCAQSQYGAQHLPFSISSWVHYPRCGRKCNAVCWRPDWKN